MEHPMRHPLAFAAFALLAATLPAAAASTARTSGTQAVRTAPVSYAPVLGKLPGNTRVAVIQCTRQARWCLVDPVAGGPSGWVLGSYLIGSAAKNAVTPFQFSFDPLDPLDLYPRHH
jgi:uncharacterized protein YraI